MLVYFGGRLSQPSRHSDLFSPTDLLLSGAAISGTAKVSLVLPARRIAEFFFPWAPHSYFDKKCRQLRNLELQFSALLKDLNAFYHLKESRASGGYANQATVRKGWPKLRAIMIDMCVKKSCFEARWMSQKV